MKYQGMPSAMWLLFATSFRKRLQSTFNYSEHESKTVSAAAKERYRAIIEKLPEFEKGDRFKMNIVSCAMFAAFALNIKREVTVEKMTEFYRKGMMNRKMKLFCRLSGLRKFSESDIEGMKKTERLKAADRNPYSWNMEFYPYRDGSGYEARFTSCGICTLLKELGLYELTPAMCRLDYIMSQAGGKSEFIRKHTLADGGPYCDCGYKKKTGK